MAVGSLFARPVEKAVGEIHQGFTAFSDLVEKALGDFECNQKGFFKETGKAQLFFSRTTLPIRHRRWHGGSLSLSSL